MVTAILIPAIIFMGIAAPVKAQVWDQAPGLEDSSYPKGRIQAIADDYEYLVPVRKPAGSWTSEILTMPFIDELGTAFIAVANLTAKNFTLYDSGQMLGSMVLSSAQIEEFRSTKLPPIDGTAVVCGGLCIALVVVFLTAFLGGAGWMIDNNYDCNMAINLAIANYRAMERTCEARIGSNGKHKKFVETAAPNWGGTCGSVGAGVCVDSN